MKIDEEKLCNFCKKRFGNRDICEGRYCQEAEEKYYEECEIQINENLSFKNLKIGDQIFLLKTDTHLPQILIYKIFSIKQRKDILLLEGERKTIRESFYIPKKYINNNQQENVFLSKKDCNQKLEEICTKRIISLSKIIGKINNEKETFK